MNMNITAAFCTDACGTYYYYCTKLLWVVLCDVLSDTTFSSTSWVSSVRWRRDFTMYTLTSWLKQGSRVFASLRSTLSSPVIVTLSCRSFTPSPAHRWWNIQPQQSHQKTLMAELCWRSQKTCCACFTSFSRWWCESIFSSRCDQCDRRTEGIWLKPDLQAELLQDESAPSWCVTSHRNKARGLSLLWAGTHWLSPSSAQ